MISFKEISQFSLLDEILYLLLQIKTLVRVMSMISVEATNLFLLRLLGSFFIFSGHFKDGSSLICIDTCSSGMFKGIYY